MKTLSSRASAIHQDNVLLSHTGSRERRRGYGEEWPFYLTTNGCSSVHSPVGTFSQNRATEIGRAITWLTDTHTHTQTHTHTNMQKETESTACECGALPWPPLSPRDAVTLFSKVWRKSFSATTLQTNTYTTSTRETQRKSFNLQIVLMMTRSPW